MWYSKYSIFFNRLNFYNKKGFFSKNLILNPLFFHYNYIYKKKKLKLKIKVIILRIKIQKKIYNQKKSIFDFYIFCIFIILKI